VTQQVNVEEALQDRFAVRAKQDLVARVKPGRSRDLRRDANIFSRDHLNLIYKICAATSRADLFIRHF
jgi:hypothetical protein